MKIIYPDNITSVSADEENANFPVENVQTDYIKEVWKATSKDAQLTLNLSSGKGAALFGCNAATAVVTLIIALGAIWGPEAFGHIGAEWGAPGDGHIGALWNPEISITTKYDFSKSGLGALWIDYDEIPFPHGILITLIMAPGGIIEVGVAKAGNVKLFQDPLMGIEEGLHDYSIKRELSNGAWYIKKRDIVRTFSFELIEDCDSAFYTFMHEIFLLRGSSPLAWRLSTYLTDFQWIVYARAEDMPKGGHDYPDYSVITISLIEVV